MRVRSILRAVRRADPLRLLGPVVLAFGLLAATVATAAPGARAAAGRASASTTADAGPFAYVAHSYPAQVSVVDTATNQTIKIIPDIYGEPRGIGASPDGRRVYVGNVGGDSVSVIDTATNEFIADIEVGSSSGDSPESFAFSPDSRFVYIGSVGEHDVAVIDAEKNEVVHNIACPGQTQPRTVAIKPDGSRLYVQCGGLDTVSVIDPADNYKIIGEIALPRETWAYGSAVSPDGSKLYVADNTDRVYVINTATNMVVHTFEFNGTSPFGVVFSPDGSRAYVNMSEGDVAVIDTQDSKVIGTIVTSLDGSWGIAILPDGSRLYISDSLGEGKVISVDTAAPHTVSPVTDSPQSPYGIAIPFKQANVRISKDAPETVTQGETITFHLRVTNDGPAEAQDVTTSDALPQGLTDITASPSQCRVSGRTVTCDFGSLGFGESHDITITARVPIGIAAGTNIENCGTVSSTTPATTLANPQDRKSCTSTTVAAAPARLTMAKSGPATARPGDPISYRLAITNHGPAPARDTKIIDKLPAELTGLTAPAGCTLDGRALTCEVGTLAASQTRVFTVTGTVAGGTAEGTAVMNCAAATTSTPVTNSEESTSCTQAIVGPRPPSADISLTKTGPAAVQAGGSVRHTITVTNHGPGAAHDVMVTDALPASLTVTGASAGCTKSGRALTCPAGTIAAGHTRTFRVSVRVSAGAAAGSSVKNCATAVSTTPDSDLSNNGSCVSMIVRRGPVTNVAVTKTGPGTAAPGQQVTYTITAVNRSRATARATLVSDVFPDELTVTRVPAGCTLSRRTLTCALGQLPAGATRTFRVTATVPRLSRGSAIGNCASVYTTTTEYSLADNAYCVQTLVAQEEVPVTG